MNTKLQFLLANIKICRVSLVRKYYERVIMTRLGVHLSWILHLVLVFHFATQPYYQLIEAISLML